MQRLRLILLMLAIFLLPAASRAQDHASCGPLPENHTLWLEVINNSCLATEPCFSPLVGQVRNALVRTPDDPALGGIYDDLTLDQGPEAVWKFIEWSKGHAERNPQSAAAQLMASYGISKGSEKLIWIAKSLKIDPDFAPAHVEALLLLYYVQDREKATKETGGGAEHHIDALRRLCPTHVSMWARYSGLISDDAWKNRLTDDARVRARKAIWEDEFPRSPSRAMAALSYLESIEGRVLTFASAMEQFEEDAATLKTLPQSLAVLDARWELAHKLGNIAERDTIGDEIISRFSCSQTAINEIFRRWQNAHGGHQSVLARTEKDAHDYMTVVVDTLTRCPHEPYLPIGGLANAVVRLKDTWPTPYLEQLANYYRQWWAWRGGNAHYLIMAFGIHTPDFFFAKGLLKRDIYRDWMNGIAAKELGEIDRIMNSSSQKQWEDDHKTYRGNQDFIRVLHFETEVLRAEVALHNAGLGEAERLLNELDQERQEIEKPEIKTWNKNQSLAYYHTVYGLVWGTLGFPRNEHFARAVELGDPSNALYDPRAARHLAISITKPEGKVDENAIGSWKPHDPFQIFTLQDAFDGFAAIPANGERPALRSWTADDLTKGTFLVNFWAP